MAQEEHASPAAVAALVPELRAICGQDGVLTDLSRRRTYESDSLTHHRAVPGVVVLPTTAEQVAEVIGLCAPPGSPSSPVEQVPASAAPPHTGVSSS